MRFTNDLETEHQIQAGGRVRRIVDAFLRFMSSQALEDNCDRCKAARSPLDTNPSITGSLATPRMPQQDWTCHRCGHVNVRRADG